MTQEKVNSPMPSMVNYPEPNTPEGISEIGFDQTGARYKVSNTSPSATVDYLLAESDLESDVDISLTTNIVWNQSTIQTLTGNIIKSVSTTRFELEPGHTYELIALVPLKGASESTGDGVQWQWFESKNDTAIGIKGSALKDVGNWTQEDDFRPAMSLFTVENEPIQVYLKFTNIYSPVRFRIGHYGYCKIKVIK